MDDADKPRLPSMNPYRWPAGWKQMHPWRVLAHTLIGVHGQQRAHDIVLGQDPETNADLESWRRIGR